MLQRVFDVTCAAAGIRKKSLQAEGLAATLLELFQSGIRDESQLKAAVSKIDLSDATGRAIPRRAVLPHRS
jgi:hypothetical protein